jgi:type I restriction enzyme M protein
MNPEPGMVIYDPCCGSAGLLIKCQIISDEKLGLNDKKNAAPLRLYGQE